LSSSQWSSKLRDSEYQAAPLILSCAFSILLLSISRDYIVNGFMPVALANVNLVTVLIFIGILTWAFRRRTDSRHTRHVMFLAASLLGTKAIAMVAIESEPYPFVLTVLVFAFSLFSLSRPFYVVATALVIGSWSVVAFPILSALQFVATLFALVLAAGLRIAILDRRIAARINLFQLEDRIGKLETLLPMCAGCKKTRDEQGRWQSVEEYLEAQGGTRVSHGICPECTKSLYGDYYKNRSDPGST
jgi:hypothetical protein